MDIVTNLLALLAIICICLAGVAGAAYLAARRESTFSLEDPVTDRTDGRNTES